MKYFVLIILKILIIKRDRIIENCRKRRCVFDNIIFGIKILFYK